MLKNQADDVDSEIACAKINLALHVRRRLPDGYHDIETIFAFLGSGDIVSVRAGEGISLAISGPFGEGLSTADNLILDAARLLALEANIRPDAYVSLDKRLPIASGIGGGSADAAAALRLLNRFWRIGLTVEKLAELSAPLGADVPACVLSQTCRGGGIGQDLIVLDNGELCGYFVLLVNPLVPVSTATIFQDWDGVDRGSLPEGGLIDVALNGRNDLQVPAERLAPAISNILTKLAETLPVMARMSGSGATCFALYKTKDEAQAARVKITAAMANASPNIWTMIGGLK